MASTRHKPIENGCFCYYIFPGRRRIPYLISGNQRRDWRGIYMKGGAYLPREGGRAEH